MDAKADREQTGPEKNRQDRGWMGGKTTQGGGGESNRVKLREQKGIQEKSSHAKQPRRQQREKLGECLPPCRSGNVGDMPGMVVKKEGIGLRLLIFLGFSTGVALSAVGGGPTAACGATVPGATFLLLRLGLGGTGSIGLGSPLLTQVAALTGGMSTAIL